MYFYHINSAAAYSFNHKLYLYLSEKNWVWNYVECTFHIKSTNTLETLWLNAMQNHELEGDCAICSPMWNKFKVIITSLNSSVSFICNK